MKDTAPKVSEIVGNMSGHCGPIPLAARFGSDVYLDGLAGVGIILELKDEFGIDLSEGDVKDFKTVGDIVRFVEAHRS